MIKNWKSFNESHIDGIYISNFDQLGFKIDEQDLRNIFMDLFEFMTGLGYDVSIFPQEKHLNITFSIYLNLRNMEVVKQLKGSSMIEEINDRLKDYGLKVDGPGYSSQEITIRVMDVNRELYWETPNKISYR